MSDHTFAFLTPNIRHGYGAPPTMQYALDSEQKRRLKARIEQNKLQRNKLTAKRRIALVKEALKGDKSQEEVAKDFGVSRRTVAYHMKRAVAA